MKRETQQSDNGDERQHPRDLAGLLTALEDNNPLTRRWAARDLAHHVPNEPANAAQALLDRLRHEDNRSVREAIFTSLTCLGDAIAVAGLVEYLRSDDADLRNEAIEALKQLPEQVAPMMEGLLHDVDPDVRIFAVNILESLRHPHVETWLIGVITQDQHVNVCATAVDLLGEVGSGAARAALQALRARFAHEPYIRFAVDLALTRISKD